MPINQPNFQPIQCEIWITRMVAFPTYGLFIEVDVTFRAFLSAFWNGRGAFRTCFVHYFFFLSIISPLITTVDINGCSSREEEKTYKHFRYSNL